MTKRRFLPLNLVVVLLSIVVAVFVCEWMLGVNWPLDGHWAATGREVTAEAIGTWLSNGQAFSFIGPPKQGKIPNSNRPLER
jgi:hypothetical protein